MKPTIFFSAFLFLTSCKENESRQEEVKADNISYSERLSEPRQTYQLKYYSCDYAEKKFDTILSAGVEHQTNEVWGVNRKDIARLPILERESLDTDEILTRAAIHIKSRFPNIQLLDSSFTLERIDLSDTTDPKNWFVDVEFLYDKRGYYQKVPVLLDGRIVLSNNE
ncbi:MAG: hypothetical protein KDE33_06430 [Bacteroidetes bacterium]|nr:hypothetical protein [Bacteroidota bacterium]